MGDRQGQVVTYGGQERTTDRRCRGDDDPCCDGWGGSGVHVGGARGAAPREWGTRACARGLVPAVPRLLPLLPPATAATSGTRGADRNPAAVAAVAVSTVGLCTGSEPSM